LFSFAAIRESSKDRFVSVNGDLRINLDFGLRIWKASANELARSTPIRTGAADEELHPLEHVRKGSWTALLNPGGGNCRSLDVP
jgi:hypothetical protein